MKRDSVPTERASTIDCSLHRYCSYGAVNNQMSIENPVKAAERHPVNRNNMQPHAKAP
ncbi:hypothetical protein [Chryseobacterium caseinilyticum]|uniref:Uncharacterized protein n=1 Tax=Chryseobacterium caseinilyticum TaxID=2771428 RepID=A0ABR8ZCY8_9FLAO|nr:hypothetical protein [Chryseobacterium caseinilyticum]MBD8083169.1 hypothetical protein [Chryseobacterium caseinilyticum]